MPRTLPALDLVWSPSQAAQSDGNKLAASPKAPGVGVRFKVRMPLNEGQIGFLFSNCLINYYYLITTHMWKGAQILSTQLDDFVTCVS